MSAVPTLYICEATEDAAATLNERAAAQGQSLSAYVGAELAKLAARPSNGEVVARPRALNRAGGPSTAEVVAAVQVGRR